MPRSTVIPPWLYLLMPLLAGSIATAAAIVMLGGPPWTGNHTSAVLLTTALTAVIMVCLDTMVSSTRRHSDILQALDRNCDLAVRLEKREKEIKIYLEAMGMHAKLWTKAHHCVMSYQNKLFRNVGLECLMDHGSNILTCATHRLSFRGVTQTQAAYLALWRYLADQQKSSNAHSEIRAVQALPIDWWFHDAGQKALHLQRQFIKNGGRIVRIFAGQAPLDDYPERHPLRRLISDMLSADITVYFILVEDIHSNLTISDFLWAEHAGSVFRFQGRNNDMDEAALYHTDTQTFADMTQNWRTLWRTIKHLGYEPLQK